MLPFPELTMLFGGGTETSETFRLEGTHPIQVVVIKEKELKRRKLIRKTASVRVV